MVAEDNEINAPLARALLACLGHRPTLVATGAQVIDAWLGARGRRALRPHPDGGAHAGDGTASRRRSASAPPSSRPAARTPIVALSTNAVSDDRDARLAAGMAAFLTKPLDRERLAELLASGRGAIAA